MQTFVKALATLLTAAAMSPLAALAHTHGGLNAPLGHAVPAAAASRTILIGADTRYINVAQGETVTFERYGKQFTWQFDTLREGRIVFGAIAPEDMAQSQLAIYVGADPVYQN